MSGIPPSSRGNENGGAVMRHGEHPQFLGLMREQMIHFLDLQTESLRSGVFSGDPPATATPRNYQNSIRLEDGRFILINRPPATPPNSALQVCLGRRRSIVHQPDQADWLDWNPPAEEWASLAQERAPWTALKLIELAVNRT